MDTKEFEKIPITDEEARTALLNEVFALRSVVNALTTMLYESNFATRGWNRKGFNQELEQIEARQFAAFIESHPFYDGWWKSKIRAELGDIPGIDL